jgi:outer membrane receptor protein involved in Fe transport
LSLNANAFYIDWSDLQFVQLDIPTGLTFVGNANKASSKGAEFEFAYRPTPQLHFSGNLTLTDAKTESDILGNMTGVIRSGTGLPAVPKYRFSLFADYRVPLNDGLDWSLSVGVNGSGATESKLERRGTYVSGFGDSYVIGSHLGSYVIGNVSTAVSSERWTASLFVRNIWNERAKLGNDNFFPVFGQPIYRNPPRTIGIELSTQF